MAREAAWNLLNLLCIDVYEKYQDVPWSEIASALLKRELEDVIKHWYRVNEYQTVYEVDTSLVANTYQMVQTGHMLARIVVKDPYSLTQHLFHIWHTDMEDAMREIGLDASKMTFKEI